MQRSDHDVDTKRCIYHESVSQPYPEGNWSPESCQLRSPIRWWKRLISMTSLDHDTMQTSSSPWSRSSGICLILKIKGSLAVHTSNPPLSELLAGVVDRFGVFCVLLRSVVVQSSPAKCNVRPCAASLQGSWGINSSLPVSIAEVLIMEQIPILVKDDRRALGSKSVLK